LTVEENLHFVGRIKGMNYTDRIHNIELVIDTMDLDEFRHTMAENLSGGNKRKLSCAATLLLCP
jgi:ABC-type multidrug transport system ATPase subunit